MKRVMIMGSSGAGKSTFARKLGALIGAPVVHLDTLFWMPGWVRCEDGEFRRRVAAAHEGEAWVSDDNYTRNTFDIRVPRADAIIWLDQPRWRCMVRILTRWAKTAGRTRDDLGPDCPEKVDLEFFDWAWNYHANVQPRQRKAIADAGAADRLTVLKGDRAAEAYLAALRESLPA